MKQAILIPAFREFNHLKDIVDFFDDRFELYIHIDKKSQPPAGVLEELRAARHVKLLCSEYKVNWGGRNHLLCILFLAAEALKNPDLDYLHLISGQDFPSRGIEDFARFPLVGGGRDFLNHFKLPSPIWTGGGMPRLDYYRFYDVLNARKYKVLIDKIGAVQSRLGIKRSLDARIGSVYGGSAWWSLTRRTLEYVMDYTDRDGYLLRRLKHTFGPDEVYFQTVIMNSPHASGVVNDDLRYVDWTPRNGSYPAVLDASDLVPIEASGKLFARKFQAPFSDPLKAALSRSPLNP